MPRPWPVPPPSAPATTSPLPTATTTTAVAGPVKTIDGMPPVPDPANIYSEAAAGKMNPVTADAKRYVYVPSNNAGTVTVIDQDTMRDRRHVHRRRQVVQHVVPG